MFGFGYGLGYISHYCDQVPDRSNLREEGFMLAHSSWDPCWEMDAGPSSLLPFWDPNPWTGATHICVGLHTSVQLRNCLRQTCLKVCLLADSRPCQVDDINHHGHKLDMRVKLTKVIVIGSFYSLVTMDPPSSFWSCPNVTMKPSPWLSSTTRWKSTPTSLVNAITFPTFS